MCAFVYLLFTHSELAMKKGKKATTFRFDHIIVLFFYLFFIRHVYAASVIQYDYISVKWNAFRNGLQLAVVLRLAFSPFHFEFWDGPHHFIGIFPKANLYMFKVYTRPFHSLEPFVSLHLFACTLSV